MDLDLVRQTFYEESMEQLQQMETLLLALEDNPGDDESLNALFRAVHTIKGSGGMFDYDRLVDFAHAVESVLDRLRSGNLSLDQALSSLLLRCRDQIEYLVEEAVNGVAAADPEREASGTELKAALMTYLSPTAAAATPAGLAAEAGSAALRAAGDIWYLSLRFGESMFRHGLDPLAFLERLAEVGEIVAVVPFLSEIPALSELEPETCYLRLDVGLRSDAPKERIEEVFEFCSFESDIRILPPRSKLSEYAALMDEMPDEPSRLGEILVQVGAVTADELEKALQEQREAARGSDAEAPPIGEVLTAHGDVQKEVVQSALDKQSRSLKLAGNKSVRVDAAKLDQLVDQVGELVIAGANSNLLAHHGGQPAMIESIGSVLRLVEEIRASTLSLRMVQIGETFNRYQRVVRDLNRELGKDIRLVISGGESELDKSVVEKIADPLMHLVRNAVDHGIEMPDEREAAGKPRQGELHLNAYQESGNIVIEVRDDGKGLDRERLRTKAVERGLIGADQALSPQEIDRLIFHPGLSTAKQVSDLSGRGVGMDVVKRNVETLRGSVEVESEPGKGTTLLLRLPLTLAIIDGFLVGVGNSCYVLPLETVMECVELPEEDQEKAERHSYVDLRGEALSLLWLRHVLGERRSSARRQNIVVIQFGKRRVGLVVDELLGEFQTVIKPLGELFTRLRGIAGSTILGSGEVAMILDVPDLIRVAVQRDSTQAAAEHARYAAQL